MLNHCKFNLTEILLRPVSNRVDVKRFVFRIIPPNTDKYLVNELSAVLLSNPELPTIVVCSFDGMRLISGDANEKQESQASSFVLLHVRWHVTDGT